MLAQTFQCVLCLLRSDFFAGLVLVEAQSLGVVGTKSLGLFEQAPEHGLFDRLEPEVVGLHLQLVVALTLKTRLFHRRFEAPLDARQRAECLPERLHEELRAMPEQAKCRGKRAGIDRPESGALSFDQCADAGDEVFTERRHALDLRAEKGSAVGVHKTQ